MILTWTYLIAAVWTGIVAFIYFSVPLKPRFLRTLIIVMGGITVLLLIFAGNVINRYFILQKAVMTTQLPGTAPAVQQPDASDELIISIAKDDTLTLNDNPVTFTTLEVALRAEQAKLKPHTEMVVTIISDPKAKYETTAKITDLLAKLKIENITFTVTDPPE